jgi:hypothetical protein
MRHSTISCSPDEAKRNPGLPIRGPAIEDPTVTNPTRISDLPDFDVTEYLGDETQVAEYPKS